MQIIVPGAQSNLEQEKLRTEPAYARQEPSSSYPALKWRYTTKYNSTDGTGQYVMVRDDTVAAGEGNWVFVPRSCLPATLPEKQKANGAPNPPIAVTTAASSVPTPIAYLEWCWESKWSKYRISLRIWGESVARYLYEHRKCGIGYHKCPRVDRTQRPGCGCYILLPNCSQQRCGYKLWWHPDIRNTAETAEATTNAATGVSESEATLNGTVNPEGLDTKYHMEYGETGSYGSATGEVDVGSGISNVKEDNVKLTNLKTNTTYHYRIVASSSAGTVIGADKSFTTPMPRPSITERGGARHVYFRGPTGQLQYLFWNGTAWSAGGYGYAGEVAGAPSAVVHSDGSEDVFYRATNGQLGQWWIHGSEWAHRTIGVMLAK